MLFCVLSFVVGREIFLVSAILSCGQIQDSFLIRPMVGCLAVVGVLCIFVFCPGLQIVLESHWSENGTCVCH